MSKTGVRFIRCALVATLVAAIANTAAALPSTKPGAFDPTFNAGTSMYKKMFEYFDYGTAIALQPDGKMLVSGYGKNKGETEADFRDFDFQPDGKIVVGASSYDPALKGIQYFAHVVRLLADGALDSSFGTAGIARLGGGFGNGARLQANGAIVYYGSGSNGSFLVPMTARLSSDGQLDPAFGTGGIVLIDPTSSNSSLITVAIGEDNRITTVGYGYKNGITGIHGTLARLIGTETTTNVIEFHNTQLNHYFVTADPNEASAIDSGAAGPGWSRTGAVWKSGGPMRVCRFYGSPETDTKSGQRKGPNSHFYAISTEECAIVKDDAGWKFESYDFSGWPKSADGTCGAGTIAVKRVYNNRFSVNDSNHRYITSDTIYDQMTGSGWSGEGTVFCAPL